MGDIHIASCVALVRPELVESAVRAIRATGIAEVPRHEANGRVVVLIEARSSRHVMDAIEAIRALEGVLSVNLAYQHVEPEEDLEETP